MATTTSYAKSAIIQVEMHARGVNCESDCQTASLAVAEWMNKNEHPTLVADYADYVAAEIDGRATPTDGSKRFGELVDKAHVIADDAATVDWADPAGAEITVTITPR